MKPKPARMQARTKAPIRLYRARYSIHSASAASAAAHADAAFDGFAAALRVHRHVLTLAARGDTKVGGEARAVNVHLHVIAAQGAPDSAADAVRVFRPAA